MNASQLSGVEQRRSRSDQPKCGRCGFVSDHVARRTAPVLVTVGVVHVLPQSRRADTDVLDAHVDFDAGDAHPCAFRPQGKAEPPGIPAVPRADVHVADDAYYPNRRPRPKCSVRTAYGYLEFPGRADPSELPKCPAHDCGAYTSSDSVIAGSATLIADAVVTAVPSTSAVLRTNDVASCPTRSRRRPSGLLLPLQSMGIGICLGTDGFRHRVVGLDEHVSVVVPSERLNAVCHLHIRFGSEVILTNPGHLVPVHLDRNHLDLEDRLKHVESVRCGDIETTLLLRTNRIEHADVTGTDGAPRRHPLVLLPGVPQLRVLGRVRQACLTAWNVTHFSTIFSTRLEITVVRIAGHLSSR